MKRYIIKKSILSAYFVLASIAILMITFPVMEMGVLPKYFLIDLSFILAITAICFLFPKVLQIICQITILIVELIIMIASASLYLSRGDVFKWSFITQIGQLKEVNDMIKLPGWSLAGGIAIILGYIAIAIFVKAKKVSLKKFYSWLLIVIDVGCLLVFSCCNVFVHHKIKTNYDKEQYFVSDRFMWDSFSSNYSSLQKFGFYGYYIEDLFRHFIKSWKPTVNLSEVSGQAYNSILNGLCEDNNVIMIYAESFDIYGISKELTPTLWALKNGVDLTTNGINDFYNVSKQNNKTTISRKDFDFNGTSYTFNGTDIYNNTTTEEVGLQLDNYASYESTDYSEMKVLTGFGWDNYSLPNILSDYHSTYIHGNEGWFYVRDERMGNNMGFDKALFVDDMSSFAVGELSGLNCYSMDSETMRHYTDDTSENVFPVNEKFFTFFMTITTHGGYSYSSYLDNNYAFVDAVASTFTSSEIFSLYNSQTSVKSAVREYFARVLDTEYSLAYLVNYLQQNNILDKTVITFTGDHKAYSNDILTFKDSYVTNILHKDYCSYINSVEGFIYSTQITKEYLENNNESRIVSHLTQSVDLVPTILTLLGKEYDQDLFMGYAVINKTIDDPSKTVYNKVLHSLTYGLLENEYLQSYDGKNITLKTLNKDISQEEKDEFSLNCNITVGRYYIVQALRQNTPTIKSLGY